MKPRYALYPGPVRSRRDGDVHHIGVAQLRMLYRVRPDECIVINPSDYNDPSLRQKLELARTLIALRPRFDGNYALPAASHSNPTTEKEQQ